MEREMIDEIVKKVLLAIGTKTTVSTIPAIPVGISNRHIHLSASHLETLFGTGYALTHDKDLKQVGEFAAKETVTLVGPKGVIRAVRVLGPVRSFTQIELSRTDGFSLGIVPPVRDSGDIEGSAGIVVVGPAGAVTLKQGVICAARHIHMEEADAEKLGAADKDRVTVEFGGIRGGTFHNVLVRTGADFRLEFHIDTDEANAVGLKNGDTVTLRQGGEVDGGQRTKLETCDITVVSASQSAPETHSCVKWKGNTKAVPAAAKTVIDAQAVMSAAKNGTKTLIIPKGGIITPLARDVARDCNMELISGDC